MTVVISLGQNHHMKNLLQPLDDHELDQLEEFLLNRIDDDEETDGLDEGIFDISTLDGFMTAIVSGPTSVQPSQWLPVIWGDFEPVWEGQKKFEAILTLLTRHMNGIAGALMEHPEEFEPMFMSRNVNGKDYLIVDEWCDGYLKGMKLSSESWGDAEGVEQLLGTLLLFASETGWEKLQKMTEDEIEKQQSKIAPLVRQVHAWRLKQAKSIALFVEKRQK